MSATVSSPSLSRSSPVPPPVSEAALMVGALAGETVDFGEARYVLKELLGVGGMGEVYLARRVVDSGFVQWSTSELAAVKVVRRDVAIQFGENLKEFADEARLHWCLDHPNVVPVRGVTETDGTLYMLMEYLEGYDLRILLKVTQALGTRLSEGAVCNILAQVADALDYVHRATDETGRPLRIVHRDLSPSNIRVTTSGEVKLMDFGVAKHDAEWREQTRSSWSGFKGKPMYLSPEQANHEPLDGRSDLFALGSILAECLIGRRLFDTSHEALTLQAIKTVSPQFVEKALQGVPDGLKAICHKLLRRDRGERYRTGREVAEALRSWAFGEKQYMLSSSALACELAELVGLETERLRKAAGTKGVSSGSKQPSSSRKRRRLVSSRLLRIASAGIFIVLALAAAYFLRPRPPPVTSVEQNSTPMPSPDPSPLEAPLLEEATPIVLTKKPLSPSVARCVGVGLVGAIAAACPPVHVPTHTRTGNCTVEAPPRAIDGHRLPDFIPVVFVSLNGERCEDAHKRCEPEWPTCWLEPCPAGEGELVMMPRWEPDGNVNRPDEFLQGALLYGKAHFVSEPASIEQRGSIEPRSFAGRMLAQFTELRLKNGTRVPICGVLFQGLFEDPPGGTTPAGASLEERARLMHAEKEGLPVLDPVYYGRLAAPGAVPWVRLYWP